VYAGVITDVGRYAVFDYHFHHGNLPFGPAAALVATGLWTGTFLVLPLVILLFPDGRLPRRWRLVLWAYLADAGLVAAYFLGAAAWGMTRQPVAVDGAGQLIKQPNPPEMTAVAVALTAALPVFWASFVARQVLSWRRATGERRQQLKWLMSGAAVTVAGLAGVFGFNSSPSLLILEIVSFFASFALPAAITVAILKYRLYEIDRIISRTLAYAIVTGLLVGVYAGLVLLATRVLSFHGPVAVAVSTLAAAALFSPLRRRRLIPVPASRGPMIMAFGIAGSGRTNHPAQLAMLPAWLSSGPPACDAWTTILLSDSGVADTAQSARRAVLPPRVPPGTM
jgi:hypothetical protein